MKTLMNSLKLSSILLTTTLLAVSSGVQEVKAQAAADNAWGRGIDFGVYCPKKYPTSTAVLVNNNVTGWKCRITNSYRSTDYGIDVGDACLKAYGYYKPHGYGNFNNPYSWFCGQPKTGSNPQYVRW
ncbi:MAG TPA: hypothetical protein DCL61_02800 [Cyanobacteria bacterium UBA12227]|nr:hypothetical protein [Cyanobacteria bacterium UBA12227]HAX89333.1 hypothetical protein [Cyanobacteria bacterium UBA11370]HBY77002.1 hypothetical protein [Cyanobacteria bacterium UBA11148]